MESRQFPTTQFFVCTLFWLAISGGSTFAQQNAPVVVNFSAPVVMQPQQEAASGSEWSPASVVASESMMVDPQPNQVSSCDCETCQASPPQPPKNPCVGSHKPLFFNNNFDYLKEPGYCGDCLGDRFKGFQVGPCGNLDLGGQLRFRYHNEKGMGQQAGFTRFEDTQNEFMLSRLRMYGDWRANDLFRVYVEGIYANVLTSNDEYVPRGIDQNFGDLLNLFADVKILDETTVRIGRQELLYGEQRLISPLDWSNVRRKFDGVNMITKINDARIDLFYTQPVQVFSNEFDEPISDVDFYGSYLTYGGWEKKTLDLYVLALNNDAGVNGTENFVTYGSRLQGSTENKLLYDFEGMVQSGQYQLTGQDLSAYAWTTGLGYQASNMCWKPTLWAFYDFASGDGPGGNYNAFNDLFPLAHKYLGFIDAVKRSNIESANMRLTMNPSNKLNLLFWYYNFQANEPSSDVPSIGGTPNQDPNAANFGNELDCLATYKVGARSSLVGGYSHFWRGTKILGDTDADFFYMQWQTNF